MGFWDGKWRRTGEYRDPKDGEWYEALEVTMENGRLEARSGARRAYVVDEGWRNKMHPDHPAWILEEIT